MAKIKTMKQFKENINAAFETQTRRGEGRAVRARATGAAASRPRLPCGEAG